MKLQARKLITHHQYRKQHDAILTTAKTILSDDPQLNVEIDGTIFKKPLYFRSTAYITPNSQCFCNSQVDYDFHAKMLQKSRADLQTKGVRLIQVNETIPGLDLQSVLKQISQRWHS